MEEAVPAVASAPAPREVAFEFRATGSEYFRIWIVNLLLTIVTLGIYSAWAKVRRLRYFYGSTALEGTSFDYHADPKAILKGRLIAVLAYVVFNSVYTLASSPAGALADRLPRPTVYAIGLVAFAAGYLGLGLLDRGAGIFVVIGVYGLFPAFTDGVGKAWVSSLVPKHRAGRAQGVFQALNNGAVLIAGLWAGLLWSTGPGHGVVPLLVAGGAALVAALVLPLLGL